MAPSVYRVHPDCEVYISIGSNMGDRLENCKRGIAGLSGCPVTELTGTSSFYLTEPIDYVHQDWFVNAVVRIRTGLSPDVLFQTLRSIEQNAGRTRDSIRYGPRILDLDILLFGDRVIETKDLVIPHPRLHKRRFVLKPICDINPDIEHPVLKKNMRSLLNALEEETQRVVAYP